MGDLLKYTSLSTYIIMDVYMKGGNDAVYRRKKDQPYYTNRHSCFLLQYHMVLVTKYRNPVLMGEVRDLVYQIIRDVLSERGLNILEMNGDEDYVHVLFEVTHIRRRGGARQCCKDKNKPVCKKAVR
jgi:putative transposase